MRTALVLSAGFVACDPGASSTGTEVPTAVAVSPSRLAVSSRPTGIWINRSELDSLPLSGPGWAAVDWQARQPCGPVDLSNQDSNANVCVLAKAFAFARTRNMSYLDDAIAGISGVVNAPTYRGRALSLGRELAAYVIAADVINLQQVDPALDVRFRAAITNLLTVSTSDGPANLIECHETRPNNWGTHCGASRVAVLAYLGDTGGVARVAQIFRGWVGDRSAYSGFKFGDLAWQCDPSAPVAVNPPNCMREGHSIDGVLPDDQRRAGRFVWPAPKENYVYEALQGAVVQAVILTQAGYPAFEWGDRALLRAIRWLDVEDGYPAAGDDTWIVYLINHYYRTSLPVSSSGVPGKGMAWTEWTHQR